ncbi:CLUMA_CG017462, isoform A [Clunio marinus]|uniref:CLUMA_CG017462, isoform A n=1 Tax=Clunio marinus TaxID=568069 RepID=A0A1J1IXD6_9DIPT|nr:CLUMA_CG017462, isoform A [Clunio marinus]
MFFLKLPSSLATLNLSVNIYINTNNDFSRSSLACLHNSNDNKVKEKSANYQRIEGMKCYLKSENKEGKWSSVKLTIEDTEKLCDNHQFPLHESKTIERNVRHKKFYALGSCRNWLIVSSISNP